MFLLNSDTSISPDRTQVIFLARAWSISRNDSIYRAAGGPNVEADSQLRPLNLMYIGLVLNEFLRQSLIGPQFLGVGFYIESHSNLDLETRFFPGQLLRGHAELLRPWLWSIEETRWTTSRNHPAHGDTWINS